MLVSVDDLYMVTVLRMRGFPAVNTLSDGRRTTWQLEATSELKDAMQAYYNHELDVDALTYSEQLRSTKGEAMNAQQFSNPS